MRVLVARAKDIPGMRGDSDAPTAQDPKEPQLVGSRQNIQGAESRIDGEIDANDPKCCCHDAQAQCGQSHHGCESQQRISKEYLPGHEVKHVQKTECCDGKPNVEHPDQGLGRK